MSTVGETGEERAQTVRAAIFSMVRDHLTAELEVPADEIRDETRFREDLDADSLDLYELVMELEDSYGVSASREETARIATVGDAVDFVFERLPA